MGQLSDSNLRIGLSVVVGTVMFGLFGFTVDRMTEYFEITGSVHAGVQGALVGLGAGAQEMTATPERTALAEKRILPSTGMRKRPPKLVTVVRSAPAVKAWEWLLACVTAPAGLQGRESRYLSLWCNPASEQGFEVLRKRIGHLLLRILKASGMYRDPQLLRRSCPGVILDPELAINHYGSCNTKLESLGNHGISPSSECKI
jgi:hypothetical protein